MPRAFPTRARRCDRHGQHSSEALQRLPVLEGVERLIILVDHDDAGELAAMLCTALWTGAGRTVVALKPEAKGTDFNDLVLAE